MPALRGQTPVNFFVEPSTRTRVPFELAAMRLSADVLNISASTSSLTKGETLKDTALTLEAIARLAELRGLDGSAEARESSALVARLGVVSTPPVPL